MAFVFGDGAFRQFKHQEVKNCSLIQDELVIPSRGLTYPTLGKGKSSSKCHFGGIC